MTKHFPIALALYSIACASTAPAAPTKKTPPKVAAKPAPKPAAPSNLAKANFELPKLFASGTPRTVRDTTATPWKERKTIFLPKGAKVLSRGKNVTSSDDFPTIGELSLITNGNKEGMEGNWVELGPGTQWVQIDLGKPTTMYGVLLWHYHGETRVYRDVIIQASNDADFVNGVATLFNNDQDNSSGLGIGKDREYYEHFSGQWIPFSKPSKARYIRFYSHGNTSDPQNQYIEAEVWGDPNK